MKYLFAGDFYPCTDKSKIIIKERQYDIIMQEVKPYVDKADFSIVNFESPIANVVSQKPYIKKGPRNLCSDKNTIECLKDAGFTMAALANNHFHDYGDIGVKQTIDTCNELQFPYCGAGMNLKEAQETKMIHVKGKVVSIVNCCENEFSVATAKSAGSNPFDIVDVVHQIQEARAKSDSVLVFVHGGIEHYQLPTPTMQKNYRFFVEAGADMVINSHQHCFSGYEFYQGKPIVYGLGNFYFDNAAQKTGLWNEGYMVEVKEEDGNYSLNLIPYIQGMYDTTIKVIEKREAFDKRIEELNSIIQNQQRLEAEFENYVTQNKRSLLAYFEPYSSRIALKLYRMGLLPSLLSKKKRVLMLNRIRCESHRLVYSKAFSQSLNFPF